MLKPTCHKCHILLLLVLLLGLCLQQFATAAPYQELAPRKGHVPVYIRHGDEALSDIHPGLSEAFKEPNTQLLQAENLTTTEAAAAAPSVELTSVKSTMETDIASFDAIKAMNA
ncbi:CG14984 [Drosophila busckii]|uniref:CG14984 n=1 Tax=Drosophila busckii TaxID=30019 RepID=A0A0M5J1E8_DROBS|nr:uncharacterized protein LOC108598671 [Drosophila busckii]ALC44824.1 CG14984 [Drosophila busckii]